jgi:hypothetical protein
MGESAVPDTNVGHEDAPAAQEDAPVAQDDVPVPGGETTAGTNWLYYCLGLGLQTFLWLLLFLAIIIAVVVGTHLTEFRYVGF